MVETRIKYMPDYLKDMRNRNTAHTLIQCYESSETPDNKLRIPNQDDLSLDTLIHGLEEGGWIYDGRKRSGREEVNRLNPAMVSFTEQIPDLDDYIGTKEEVTIKAVTNSFIRLWKFFNISEESIRIMFASPVHGGVLSQELYEAGWDWKPVLG